MVAPRCHQGTELFPQHCIRGSAHVISSTASGRNVVLCALDQAVCTEFAAERFDTMSPQPSAFENYPIDNTLVPFGAICCPNKEVVGGPGRSTGTEAVKVLGVFLSSVAGPRYARW